jgi:MFS family permease
MRDLWRDEKSIASPSGMRARMAAIGVNRMVLALWLGIALGPLIAGLLAVFFFELPFLIVGFGCLIGVFIVWRWME